MLWLRLSVCVSVSPDCSRLTSGGLQHIGKLRRMRILALQEVRDGLVRGQGGPGGWVQGVQHVDALVITGELQRNNTPPILAPLQES